jgi:ribonuclease J
LIVLIFLNPGKTPSEAELIPSLEKIIQEHDQRIFFTLFASNIYRINNIVKLAQKYKRKIILSGASIKFYIEAAMESGIIDSFTYYDEDQTKQLGSNVIVLISGCQGDFFSSLKRYVNNEHSKIPKMPNDLVVFSSKTIPGNEKRISQLLNKLSEDNIRIITDKDMLIHASGHPGQADLHYLYSKLNFTHVVPIHGESFFLLRHQNFLNDNYPKIITEMILNYDSILIKNNGSMEKVSLINFAQPLLFTKNISEIDRSEISTRRKIAAQGLVLAQVNGSRLVELKLIGLPLITNQLPSNLNETLTRLALQENIKQKDIVESTRIVIRRYFGNIIGEKPIVYVLEK